VQVITALAVLAGQRLAIDTTETPHFAQVEHAGTPVAVAGVSGANSLCVIVGRSEEVRISFERLLLVVVDSTVRLVVTCMGLREVGAAGGGSLCAVVVVEYEVLPVMVGVLCRSS